MTMGTRVAVLKNGVLQQVDSPQALYDHPANAFVAAFIGSPSMNLYQGTLTSTGDSARIDFGSQSLPVPSEMLAANPELTTADTRSVVVGLRPEALSEPTSETDGRPTIEVGVELVEALGSELIVHASIDARAAEIDDPDLVEATPMADGTSSLCIARLPPKTELTIGQRLHLAVDRTDMQIFDATTGISLRAN